MDLENLTMQELVKIEGFAERCRVARRYPLTMTLIAAQRDHVLLEIFDKLPSILVSDEEQFIARLAGLEAEGEQNAPAKKAEEKPAAEAKPAAAPATKAEEQKPAAEAVKVAAKPAEGNRGAGRPPKAASVAAGDIPDFDKLTNSELRDFCIKNSVISRIKKDMGNSKRESMIAWCKQHFGTPAHASAAPAADPAADPAAEPAKAAAKPAEKAEEKPVAEPPSPYEGLSAKELFCICKERGLTVAERQPADVYRDALSLDDMAREAHEAKEAAEAQKAAEPVPEEKEAAPDITAVPVPEADEEAEEFDDWDDVEPAKEPAKEQEDTADDDDDDDDWDI